MSTPDSQERIKEEAKAIRARIEELIKDTDKRARAIRATCIYAGMMTETLLDYEEPDVVMEQAFHRVADLLKADPAEEFDKEGILPDACVIDHDTELGRQIAELSVKKLPKGLDDVHEIVIALVINDFPSWEKGEQNLSKEVMLRLLIETVIASLTFEMATQDFCDSLIEDFISEGFSTSQAVLGIAAVAGSYFAAAQHKEPLPRDAEKQLMNVMVRESIKHGTQGTRNWEALAAANDEDSKALPKYMEKIKPPIEEFFVLIGLDEPMARAVAVAKAVGRMVAVITVEDIGQIHPSIAKSLAKTGMILGLKYREQIKT